MRRLLLAGLCLLIVAGGAAGFPGGRAARARVIPASEVSAGPAGLTAGTRSALLYDFWFAGSTGKVANRAPDGPALTLTLSGSWSPVAGGVYFHGNTTGQQSVAYGKRTTGYTLNATSTEAVGFGARFWYHRPATGTCFGDSPNVTQIGRYGRHIAGSQIKIQFSSCDTSKKHVFVECRISGATSPVNAPPVVGTTPLANKAGYDVSCVKAPDSGGRTAITLRMVSLATGVAAEKKFSVPAVGAIQTTQYMSAGNKYPLPTPANNTDQFVGKMSKAVYCTGSTDDVQHCLSAYLRH